MPREFTLTAQEADLVVDALIAFRDQKLAAIAELNAMPMFKGLAPLDATGFRADQAEGLLKRIERHYGVAMLFKRNTLEAA